MNFKSFLKKLAIVSLIGAGIGILIGISFPFLDGDQIKTVETIFNLILVFAVVGAVIFTSLREIKFVKEIRRLLKILNIDIDVERYMNEIQEAINKTKNKTHKLCLSINMAVGYSAKGEYKKAIDYMLNLNIKDLNSTIKAVYYNNLAYFYCEANNLQGAIKAYSQGEKFINKLLKDPYYCATFLNTKGAIEYLIGHLAESEKLFEESKLQQVAGNHLITSANLYLAKIYMKTNRKEKGKLLLDYNMMQKLLPNVEMETRKIFEEMQNINF